MPWQPGPVPSTPVAEPPGNEILTPEAEREAGGASPWAAGSAPTEELLTVKPPERLEAPPPPGIDCPACGARNEPTRVFCHACGERLVAPVQAPLVTAASTGRSAGQLIGVVVLVLVALAIGIALGLVYINATAFTPGPSAGTMALAATDAPGHGSAASAAAAGDTSSSVAGFATTESASVEANGGTGDGATEEPAVTAEPAVTPEPIPFL